MADSLVGQHRVFVDADDPEVFVVIVSTPDQFSGNQTYGYTLTANFDPGAVPEVIFRDDFESGNLNRWSASVP